MFGDGPPPVMRGDLFSLLDSDGSDSPDGSNAKRDVTPEGIARSARRLVERVQTGERSQGSPVVMQCLEELAALEIGAPMRAFSALSSIRQRLKSLGLSRSRGLPGRLVGERVLVLPQTHRANVLRVLPAAEHRVWYVATREGVCVAGQPSADPFADLPRPQSTDTALGPSHYDRPEVTFRLYRFGEAAADIRLCMRVIQEPGSYCDVRVAGDGRRVAMLSKNVIGVFEGDGRPILSGRLPLGGQGEASDTTEVAAMALDGDILGLNLKHRQDRPAELALVSIAERRGFPVSTVGDEADGLVLGSRQAYVLDGVQLVRLPLFSEGVEPVAFSFRPWFSEYPWSARHLMSWDGQRVWLGNGNKLIVLSDGLDRVLAEIVLPEPVIDFTVTGDEVRLVHHDVRAGRLRVAHWVLAEDEMM